MVNAPETSLSKNIWIAAGDGDLERVKQLIESGVSPNAKDENTYTPMHAATSWGHVEVLKYLLEKGGDMNITDEDGDTPLYTVESLAMARLVIELGGNPVHRNAEGLTAADSLEEDNPTISVFLRTLTGVPQPAAQLEDPPSDPTDALTSNLLIQAEAIMTHAEATGTQDSAATEALLRAAVEQAVTGARSAGETLGGENVQAEAVESGVVGEQESNKRMRTDD